MKQYAKKNNIGSLYVKDESQRFSKALKAFKATGGLYAMAYCIAKQAGLSTKNLKLFSINDPVDKKSR